MSDQALLRLQELQFQGAGSYVERTEVLPLAGQGTVLITGPEGSGKSMIPEVMTLILYSKGSPRVRKTGLVESSIVNKKTGYQGQLIFDTGFDAQAQRVEITQSYKFGPKKKNRYTITIDGEEHEIEGKPAQKKFIKRLAPLSLDEWLGVVYLHQGGIHDLLAGTPSEKRAYLTSVFGLDFYDDLVSVTADSHKLLIRKSSGAEVLEQKLKDLEEEKSRFQGIVDSTKGGIEGVRERLAKTTKSLENTNLKLGKLSAQKKTAEAYAEIVEQLEGLSEADSKAQVEDTAEQIKKLTRKKAEAEASLKSVVRDQARFNKSAKRIARLKKSGSEAKARKKAADEAAKGLPGVKVLSPLLNLVSKAPSMDLPHLSSEEHEEGWVSLAKEAEVLLATAKKVLSQSKTKMSSCPTCYQEVSKEHFAKVAKDLEKSAAEADEKAGQDLCFRLLEVTDWWVPDEGTCTTSDVRSLVGEALEALAEKKEAAEDLGEISAEYKEAKAEHAELPEPPSAEGLEEEVDEAEEELKSLEKAAKEASRVLRMFDKASALKDSAEGIDLDALEEQAAALVSRREGLEERESEIQQTLAEVNSALGSIKTMARQICEVEEQIQEHAENAALIKEYENTLTPYFDTMRAQKVSSCVSVLEGVLPVYVSAMASSQYKGAAVKLQVSNDLKKVDMLLQCGAGSPWLSAFQTSGGQRQRFTTATIAALREVSPRKANVMFFDEPFAHLEAEGKMMFVQRLLPLLHERCTDLESIFVTAHDKEVLESANDTFDSVWVTARTEEGSTIKRGQKLSQVEGK